MDNAAAPHPIPGRNMALDELLRGVRTLSAYHLERIAELNPSSLDLRGISKDNVRNWQTLLSTAFAIKNLKIKVSIRDFSNRWRFCARMGLLRSVENLTLQMEWVPLQPLDRDWRNLLGRIEDEDDFEDYEDEDEDEDDDDEWMDAEDDEDDDDDNEEDDEDDDNNERPEERPPPPPPAPQPLLPLEPPVPPQPEIDHIGQFAYLLFKAMPRLMVVAFLTRDGVKEVTRAEWEAEPSPFVAVALGRRAPPNLARLLAGGAAGRPPRRRIFDALASLAHQSPSPGLVGWDGMATVRPLVVPGVAARQFEFSPLLPGTVAVGSHTGTLSVICSESGAVKDCYASPTHSMVLGLSWLHKDPKRLLCGTDDGSVSMFRVGEMASGYCHKYRPFDGLTNVNVNCEDAMYAVSGYPSNVHVRDLATGQLLHDMVDAHRRHANVIKFAFSSPHLLATSSFDHTVKMWDLRVSASRPLWAARSSSGNTMVCFSPDDRTVMASALDNEIRIFSADSGALERALAMPRMGSEHNYTRSYFMTEGRYVISGSCCEPVLRVVCTSTGRTLTEVSIDIPFPGEDPWDYPYLQSLRGNPWRPLSCLVLGTFLGSRRPLMLNIDLFPSN